MAEIGFWKRNSFRVGRLLNFMEKNITIYCDGFALEGLFDQCTGNKGVVITHPHPLYGGEMHNPVVDALKNVYADQGYSTLRFNFRGAGASEGTHDNGRGEQQDVLACIKFLKAAGIESYDLAGYSFGAWVISQLTTALPGLKRLIMVAPPVAMMDFSGMKKTDFPVHSITGSLDDIAPPQATEELTARLGTTARLTVIKGADHFYSGYQGELESAISDAII